MIQDSVTIIVLGNKYNRNIYEAKDLEGYFDSEMSPNNEENEAMRKEEINTNETPDSLLNKKIEFSKPKTSIQKPAPKRPLKKSHLKKK
jgi:hypothetical protein